MTFRQFAVNWIYDNVSNIIERNCLSDLVEIVDNYLISWKNMETVLDNFQKLVAAWKEYQEK